MKLFLWISHLALLVAAALIPSKSSAQNLSIGDLLSVDKPHNYIDNLTENSRENAVKLLFEALREPTIKTDAAKVLCAMKPWTTGNQETDAGVQAYAWAQMAVLDSASAEFRWLDCAASNRVGYYRDKSLSPLYDIRQSYCTGIPVSKDMLAYFDSVADGIVWFNDQTQIGLASAAEQANTDLHFSYYPLRNSIRLATVRSAFAVELAASDVSWSEVQSVFSKIGQDLEAVLNKIDFRNTRNGWHFHNDLVFYRAFYSWLGEGSGNLDLSALIDWPTALGDQALVNAIPEKIREDIALSDQSYVDMIFLERLLPGAAGENSECGGWRRRHYNTHKLAEAVQNCANRSAVPSNIENLRTLDRCILKFEADDWRVQFMTIEPKFRDSAEAVIDSFVESILKTTAIEMLSEDARARVANALSSEARSAESASKGRVKIISEPILRTSDRTVLELAFDELQRKGKLPWGTRPLMARPRLY